MMLPTSLLFMWLVAGFILSISGSSGATNLINRPSTKGQRRKGWRRRAQNWASADGSAVTSTIVTNPSTLKGKGGEGTVVYDEEDDNGRTTFVINCKQAKALAAEKAGEKATLEPKSIVKTSGKVGGVAETAPDIGVKATKTVPNDICDEANFDGDGNASIEGGDGSGNNDIESEGSTMEPGSGTEIGTGTDDEVYPPPDTSTSQQVSGSVEAPPPCVDIAALAGPFGDKSIEYNVSLDVVKQANLSSEGIMRLMRADLQYNVAPVIADCTDGSGMTGNGVGSTNITDVRFKELVEDAIGCSAAWVQEATSIGGACLNTIVPVELYYEGNETGDFLERVQAAINNHQWNVPGLIKASNDNGGGLSVSSMEANQAQENDSIGPAGYLTIAAAALVLLLLALMLVRRKRRDEMVKHVSLSDEDTYLKDIEGDSNASGSPGRLARVVGDGDSIGTGWTGDGTQFRNFDNATNGMWSGMESRPSHQDVHICSSATCEVCERHRQSGVQFIPSGTNLPHPRLPPDTPRKYGANDTVAL